MTSWHRDSDVLNFAIVTRQCVARGIAYHKYEEACIASSANLGMITVYTEASSASIGLIAPKIGSVQVMQFHLFVKLPEGKLTAI